MKREDKKKGRKERRAEKVGSLSWTSFRKAGEVLAESHAGETMQIWHGLYRGSLERQPIGGESEGSWKPKKLKREGEKEKDGEGSRIQWSGPNYSLGIPIRDVTLRLYITRNGADYVLGQNIKLIQYAYFSLLSCPQELLSTLS